MSDSDYERVFGARAPEPTDFAGRLGRDDGIRAPSLDGKEITSGDGPYKAYGFLPTGTVGEGCDVRRWLDASEVAEGIEFQYRFLMQLGYVGDEQLKLFLPDCIVVIEGRNLRELRKKLARRMVTFIQQYNPRIWPLAPEGDTVIERIDVVRPGETKGGG